MKMKIITLFTFLLCMIFIGILIGLYLYLNINYVSFNGEYVKSINSPHVFCITDICFEKKAVILSAKVINNSIHVVYFLKDKNCLKLARSNSLTPQSPKDWQTSEVLKDIMNNDTFSKILKENLPFDDSILFDQYSFCYRTVDGKPSFSFLLSETDNNNSTSYTLNLLIAKTENPTSINDWVRYKNHASNFDDSANISFRYYKGQYLFLYNEFKFHQKNNSYLDDVVIVAFDPKSQKWIKHYIINCNPAVPKVFQTSFVENNNQLLILYIQRDAENRKALIDVKLLSLANVDLSNSPKWHDTFLTRDYYKNVSRSIGNSTVYDENSNVIYCVLQDRKSSLNLLKINVFNEMPRIINKDYLRGYTYRIIKYQSGGLMQIPDYQNLSLVNNKPVYTDIKYGNMLRYEFKSEIDFNKVSVSNIEIFSKLFSSPDKEIFPLPIDKQLSYIYFQPNLGKLRLAREVDPRDIPKRKTVFKYSK